MFKVSMHIFILCSIFIAGQKFAVYWSKVNDLEQFSMILKGVVSTILLWARRCAKTPFIGGGGENLGEKAILII